MSVLPAFTKCMRLIIFDSRNSSVGRALDWRSKGPWFNPGFRHPAVVTFYVIILLFDQCSLPTFRISQQLIWTWLLYTEETTTPPTFLVVCIPFALIDNIVRGWRDIFLGTPTVYFTVTWLLQKRALQSELLVRELSKHISTDTYI